MFAKPYRTHSSVVSTSEVPYSIWYGEFPREVQKYTRVCEYCGTSCKDDDRTKCVSCGAPLID